MKKPQMELDDRLLAALLQNPHESQIVVDAQGVVRFMSEAARQFYGLAPEEAVGRSIVQINPESGLMNVLKTGKAEIGRVFFMGGRQRVVARIPLKDDQGRVIGAAGKLIFWHLERVGELVRQTEVLAGRLDYYEKELRQLYGERYSLERVVGQSPAMQQAKRIAAQAAASELAVLITGETGTGKELFAHAIHQMSPRRDRPLVRVNCAAIPGELFEAELFGYEAGAFTGASPSGKPGRFELAHGGTIFLDEVGELPLALQAKLLRVIQERQVERLGGAKPLNLDFRVIAATNRDLEKMMKAGQFRQDLFYRLNIFRLHTPPLREMSQDLPRLCYALLARIRAEGGRAPVRIEPEAMARLRAYGWPGNARELRNILERASAEAAGDQLLRAAHLPTDILEPDDEATRPMGGLRAALELAERRAIARALESCGGNRARAARLLGIHRSGLYQKMRRHGLVD
ncbi:PAS modulated sigma54 specific transcriptional regulator, Fis family [Desulfarculus baarsii DSM 2075]|uniref:PAS modulated sigma54 specific transcriptional regulator, Fis family n=1 Tax=Desulfarculus baarsii (strain ATCC 33931 / DSM 2075 / LMG 7858 / VKM B-1802 / 2st14) TaxID=644282 RepID=E1QJS0_DESB2|nr:sigma-54-dependent Fis family transcriptional regulator [Desulfarculus baarsii]ADK85813.1 PAS modulated sigma54 specific transcriptional regulator, Fis family [Desulfarculus baarsii DSM 2075]